MKCFSNIIPQIYLFLIQVHILLREVIASINILDKGLVSLQKESVGLQFYIDIENKEKSSGCFMHVWAEDCCLTDADEDCDTMSVFGGYYYVPPKDRETITFVYPSLHQHNQVGYCNFILDSQCGRNTITKRQKVNIVFDTRVRTDGKQPNPLLEHYIGDGSATSCETFDQDSFNDCEPVNCDYKYSGERPFYDVSIGKCVKAALCESNLNLELPDIIYIPSSNTCRDLEHPLTVGDIYAISTGLGVVKKPPKPDEVKVEVKSNCSTISQNLKLLKDIMCGKLCPVRNSDMSDYSKCCKSAIFSIITCITGICALLLAFVCLIQTIAWLHKKNSEGELQNCFEDLKSIFKTSRLSRINKPGANSDVRNALLREVIVRDIPIELRDSMVDICERMEKKVKRKKRYRREDVGSQISLRKVGSAISASKSSSSSTDECDEEQKLLK